MSGCVQAKMLRGSFARACRDIRFPLVEWSFLVLRWRLGMVRRNILAAMREDCVGIGPTATGR
eukprot:121427-Alexandrium_andersonii.AAC.1